MASPANDVELSKLRSELDAARRALAEQAVRIENLLALVESLQRGQKRQAAPFSKGPPKPDPKTPGRKPGDAYGRHAHRAIPPVIDETYEATLPLYCPHCNGDVAFEKIEPQYQTEIPRTPIHRQFNVHIGRCACCRKRVQGRHSLQSSNALGAANSQLGPDAQALATILNKDAGLSHGKISRFFHVAFGIGIVRATPARTMLRAAQRVLPAYGEIQIAVKNSHWVVPDETGWKVSGALQWLHVFVTARATLYLIRPSRGFDVPEEALGATYSGDMTHDGWPVYEQFYHAHHGACNGHLFVRCDRLLKTAAGRAVVFPRAVKALLHEGLAVREARDAGEITLAQAAEKAGALTRQLGALSRPKTHAGNERLAKFLSWNRHDVFNHLRRPALFATNWRAEQAIRPAVVNRKVWGGNRTENGAHAQGILTSVLRTLVQTGKDTLDFIAQTLRAPPGATPQLLPSLRSSLSNQH
jgi:transposase